MRHDIALNASLGLLLSLAVACGPANEQNTDCGAGAADEIDGQTYCVYTQDLIIEGFECPNGMTFHELPEHDISVCGGPDEMEIPEGHIEELVLEHGDRTQCAAVPVCPEDSFEADAQTCADAGDVCTRVTECGSSVDCIPKSECGGGSQNCPEGYVQSSEQACIDAGDDCVELGRCGERFDCVPEATCDAVPTCPVGKVEADSEACDEAGDDCTLATECGTTLACVTANQCAALPTCPNGTDEIDETMCGVAGADCTNVTECGETAHCLMLPDACDDAVGVPAACLDGETEVQTCAADTGCFIRWGSDDQCDTYVFCQED